MSLVCAHGEVFEDADPREERVCTYCCTPYGIGEYREHCAGSPSHVDERDARKEERRR